MYVPSRTQRLTPYVPEPVKPGGPGLTFAKSKRTYTLSRVETDLREAKKGQLYASMSDPISSIGQPDPDSTASTAAVVVAVVYIYRYAMLRFSRHDPPRLRLVSFSLSLSACMPIDLLLIWSPRSCALLCSYARDEFFTHRP